MTNNKIYVGVDNQRVEATGQAFQDILDYRAQKKTYKETQQAEAQANASAKSALLAKLGITEDEAKLLLG